MKLTWLGHAAVAIQGSRTVYIDPFLTGNPASPVTLKEITQADAVVVTHDHGDHLGDAFALCQQTGAVLFCIYEIALEAGKKGIESEMMNIGGTIHRNGIGVSLVPAWHTSGLGGTAVGAVVEMDGKTVYHAGDTGLSVEMQWIGEIYRPDIACIPIDGRFTMTPRLAAKAVEWLGVKQVIPIHYNTFPAIRSSPEEFRRLCGGGVRIIIPKPGESVEI